MRRLTGQAGWTLLVFSFCSVELGEGGMTGEENKMEEDWVSRDGGGTDIAARVDNIEFTRHVDI